MNKINYKFDFEIDICIITTMTKTNKERVNMFKNIDLEKLTYDELQLLGNIINLYVSNNNPEVISEFDKAELQDYENKIWEAQAINNYADELEKEYNQQQKDNAKMYALNDIERDNQ